jgi:hypothetical protein
MSAQGLWSFAPDPVEMGLAGRRSGHWSLMDSRAPYCYWTFPEKEKNSGFCSVVAAVLCYFGGAVAAAFEIEPGILDSAGNSYSAVVASFAGNCLTVHY